MHSRCVTNELIVQDTDADGIVSKDELLNAMTLLRGNRSEAEVGAVKKLLDGRQTVTLEQLEECVLIFHSQYSTS